MCLDFVVCLWVVMYCLAYNSQQVFECVCLLCIDVIVIILVCPIVQYVSVLVVSTLKVSLSVLYFYRLCMKHLLYMCSYLNVCFKILWRDDIIDGHVLLSLKHTEAGDVVTIWWWLPHSLSASCTMSKHHCFGGSISYGMESVLKWLRRIQGFHSKTEIVWPGWSWFDSLDKPA